MGEPVYFLRLEVENYRCFKERQVLDLSDGKGNWKKWTIILGDNGTGKSTVLQLLASGETEERITHDGKKLYGPTRRFFNYKDNNGVYRFGLNIFYSNSRDQFDTMLEVNSGILIFDDEKLKELKCFGYGANRKMGNSSLGNSISPASESLFNEDANLINAEEWLLQLDYAASKDSEIKNFVIEKRERVKQILLDLLPDIHDINFTTPTIESLKSSVEFETPFGWVSIHQLSLGYKTMVTWMVDLAARMFDRYPNSADPLSEPAIVLVDEIDLHLHPKWQRKIFNYLSDKFPATQFIITAHSPLIVQSAPVEANIVLLRKEKDQVVVDNDRASVQNWRLDQILASDLFGFKSSRGAEAEKKLEERKQLLAKKDLTNEERKRLDELNSFAHLLPTAYKEEDIDVMNVLQEAAEYLRNRKK